jgi:transcriptional regulator with XRE-family HTH domain
MTTYGAQLEAALSKQIKIELVERGMDQKDLADAVGVHRVTMSHYMKGNRNVPMPVFFKMAEALGLSPLVLMQRAEARIQPAD